MRGVVRPVGWVLAAVALGLTLRAGSSPAASAPAAAAVRPPDGEYLALGDSVPFGYDPHVTLGSPPSAYVGYPELAGRLLGLAVTDLTCPGETSGGFRDVNGPDNGCRLFRRAASLHTEYPGSQLDAAVAFLRSHPRTRLVTLTIGSNDLSLCRRATAGGCTAPADLRRALATYVANLDATLRDLRRVYAGRLLLVTYYAKDYRDPARTSGVEALNRAGAERVVAAGGEVASGYVAFSTAAAGSAGDACRAGLLVRLRDGTCDGHPSRAGSQLLAETVAASARQRHPAR